MKINSARSRLTAERSSEINSSKRATRRNRTADLPITNSLLDPTKSNQDEPTPPTGEDFDSDE
jgi:hypothetical protein